VLQLELLERRFRLHVEGTRGPGDLRVRHVPELPQALLQADDGAVAHAEAQALVDRADDVVRGRVNGATRR
jgi:hypothetical protein